MRSPKASGSLQICWRPSRRAIAFNAWAALLGSLSKVLDVKTRDSIGLAVSEVNGCNYCLTVHSFAAQHMAKLPADDIILARNGHARDPKRDAAVQFARKVIETRGKVSDADLSPSMEIFSKRG
jgi:AhpD family alkylhydroperoxidase